MMSCVRPRLNAGISTLPSFATVVADGCVELLDRLRRTSGAVGCRRCSRKPARRPAGTSPVGFRIGNPRRPMSPLNESVRSRSGPAAVRCTIAEPRMCPASMKRNRTTARDVDVLAVRHRHDLLDRAFDVDVCVERLHPRLGVVPRDVDVRRVFLLNLRRVARA